MQLELPASVTRHIKVLRLKQGDKVTLFNGDGKEYLANILDINRSGITAEIVSCQLNKTELSYRITLAQSLPEAAKMDWIIEKAVELGVSEICPVESKRCVVRLTEERAEKRTSRWKNIIIAASEQSGRSILAELSGITGLQNWLEQYRSLSVLILSPNAKNTLADWAFQHPPQNIAIMIGPEGGFSQEEETLALRYGAIPLSLGERILRTETAGMAAVSALNAIWMRTITEV